MILKKKNVMCKVQGIVNKLHTISYQLTILV